METLCEILLIANDLSAFESPRPLPSDLDIAANLLPNTEYFSQGDYDRDIARTVYLLFDLAPGAKGTSLPELGRRLQELLGNDLITAVDLALACFSKVVAADAESIPEYRVPLIRASDFATTTVPVEVATVFLESISATEGALAASIRERDGSLADLTVFRETPLVRVDGSYLTLDVGFVLDKAGKGLFWSAVKNAPSEERGELLAKWGGLFELYVNQLLAGSLGQRSVLLRSPMFEGGAQACDAAVIEGRTLVLLEHKASTIRAEIRYADDPGALASVLKDRFVTGDGGGCKGLAQLWNAVDRFARGERIFEGRTGTGVCAKDVDTIVPVLVHLDNILRTPGLPHYLAARFKRFGEVKSHRVLPLTALPIGELEDLEGYLHGYRMSELIESFHKLLRDDRTSVFLTRMLPILQGQPRKPGPTLQRFERYVDQFRQRLFPNGDADTLRQ